MAKVCPVTGKRTRTGNNVSHANNKTRRRWEPNLQWKRIWVPRENRFVRMRISARGLRTIGKLGFAAAAKTGHFYTTTSNPKLSTGKLDLRKFDSVIRKHVLYREGKA